MAIIPTPRSRNQIVGDMLDALLSKIGLPSVQVGSAALSIIEAAAQSDLRSSQDIFNLLNSQSLDRAERQALDAIGRDEDTARIAESAAHGPVTISDSSFKKISTKLFQGSPAPIVGATTLNVTDASTFPASGSVYVGRGTTNYEGPLAYTSKTNNTNYWTLNLASGNATTKYHNLGETVTLSQGGDRAIAAGTIVQTAQSNAGTSVQFATNFVTTIPAGETSINGVQVTAKLNGLIGNVVAGSINSFTSPPFVGATITNPLPFSNGLATEDDNTYRERIRAVRQSRSRGTALSIKTGITGITSLTENKRILSSSVVTHHGYPTTVYIDDGSGYEESSLGIPAETLVDQALGGEKYFQLVHGRPVAKAYVSTSFQAPFILAGGSALAVNIGGKLTEHVFSASSFRSISNASAYEVVASINANQTLGWAARTLDSGTRVAIFAKSDVQEDVEVIVPSDRNADANNALSFSLGRVDTLRLYKNDILLTKDGFAAEYDSNPYSSWGITSTGETIQIKIDDVNLPTSPINTFVFTDADFVNAGTSYTTVATTNSLASWAKVFNYKIPGVTATIAGGILTLTSNRQRVSTATVEILGGTLVAKNFFPVGKVTGKTLDYTLDRNLGQIRLEPGLVLSSGDRLTVGSNATRAFLESGELTTVTIGGAANTSVSGEAGAELWFVVDGSAQLIPTRIGTSTAVEWIDIPVVAWGHRVRIHSTPGLPIFENAQVGDWLVINDSAVSITNRGAYRIAAVDAGGTYVDTERPISPVVSSVNLAFGGMYVVRTTADLQRVYLPAASNYTATSFVTSLNAQLRGATANTYRTRQFRVRTNSFLVGGDIALVATNVEGRKLTLAVGSAVQNQTSHLAAIVAGNPEAGTPQFDVVLVASSTNSSTITLSGIGNVTSDALIVGLKATDDVVGTPGTRLSNRGHISTIDNINGAIVTLRRPAIKEWVPTDRLYAAAHYALGPADEFTVVLDGDTDSRRFVVPTFRRVKPGSSVYGITNDLKDADNGNQSLAKAFGFGMDFRDFAVFMSARAKSHRNLADTADTNQTILWRYKRQGLEGTRTRIQFTYPTAPSSTTLVSWSAANTSYTDIGVALPSGAARTGVTLTNAARVGTVVNTASGNLGTFNYILNLTIGAAIREVRLDYTSGAGTRTGTVTGGTSLATATVVSDSGTYLVLSSVSGTFTNGEALTFSGGGTAVANGTQYGVAKLTLNLPSGVTLHGFSINNQLYVAYSSGAQGAGFLSGPKVVTEIPTLNQISFREGTTSLSSFASAGTVSFDTAEAKTTGSTVVAGDIQNVSAASSLLAQYEISMKIQTVTDGSIVGQVPYSGAAGTSIVWLSINSVANIRWFPVSGSTITNIAAAVNAQTSSPVSAVAVGDGAGDTSGSITYATYENSPNGLGSATVDAPWYYLADGLNYVRNHTNPLVDTSDYNFTFKTATTSRLAVNSDWVNEDLRLVPVSAENVSEYLSTSGAGGLFANGEAVVSTRGGNPQISTTTPGSLGSVQVQGGTANALSAGVQGQAKQVATTYSLVTVPTSDTLGLTGSHWMRLQNSVTMPKRRIDSGTVLTSLSPDGTVVFGNTGTKAWDFTNGTGVHAGFIWQVEKQGNFVAFQWDTGGAAPGLSTVQEGDWVHVGATGTLSVVNQGLFRIVRCSDITKTFWIENPNALEQTGTATLAFLTYDSIVPGDKLVISTTRWGSDNLGIWTVKSIDLTTYDAVNNTDNRWKFTLDTSTRTPVTASTTALSAVDANSVTVFEGSASHLFKKVYGISPNPLDVAFSDVKFDTWIGSEKVSEAAGTTLISLDKLSFPTSLATGIDAYRHSLGLIEEANRVGYGDESSPGTYPGLIAAGANVNIEGPLVHRVQVSFALRVRSGVSARDIKTAVRSAVASQINKTGVGQPVALSDLITVAQSVNGVVSVTVLSPSFGPGTDLISIQPYEKPLVLNLDEDILISFVGE